MFDSNRKVYLLFRNDDLCALSSPDKERSVFRLFERYSVPQVIGVIPKVTEDQHDCHNQSFHPLETNPAIVSLLKEYHAKGLIEIAQHGLTHRTNTRHFALYPEITEDHYFQGMNRKWLANHAARVTFSEFNGLPAEECRSKILEGKEMLEGIFGVPIKTFVFPWNSLNKSTLKVVRDCGFAHVCYGQSHLGLEGINTIRYYHWDHLKVPEFFREISGVRSDIFTQFTYHSWMLSDKDEQSFEKILKDLALRKDVRFILPGHHLESVPKAVRILSLSAKVGALAKRARRYESGEIWDYPFYILDEFFYARRWLRAMKVLMPVEVIGVKRCLIILLVSAGLLFWIFFLINKSLFWIVPEVLGIAVSSWALVALWRMRRNIPWKKSDLILSKPGSSKTEKLSHGGLDDLAVKVYADPMDKILTHAFLDLYEKSSPDSAISRQRYLQLRYLHRRHDAGALDALGDNFSELNKNSLAFMCWVESLRFNPEQAGVLDKALRVKEAALSDYPDSLPENQCLVSVIMPTYNRVNRLNDSLMSLRKQTLRDFELIIVNDGGNTDVKSCLDRSGLNNYQYIDLPVNRGVSAATNLAIRQARGKYIAYLDDDDIYYPDYLAVMTETLRKTGVPLVYANTYILSGHYHNGRYEPRIVEDVRDVDYNRNDLLTGNIISQVALVHEKSIFMKVGLVNEDMNMSQDLDFWLRCALVSDFHHVPLTLSEYRRSADSSVVNLGVEKCFFSQLLRNYYGFYKGKIALFRSNRYFGAKKASEILYEGIRNQYASQFQNETILNELIMAAYYMRDHSFRKRLQTDFGRIVNRKKI